MGPQHSPRRRAFALLRGDDSGEGRQQSRERACEIGPCLYPGAGVRPWFSLFSVPRIEGDGAPRWRPGYPGCPVGSGLVETHRSLDAPAPLGAPYAASSAISLIRVPDRGRLNLVRPRGWSFREPPRDAIASHARRCRIPPHRCAPARTPLGGRDKRTLPHPFEHNKNYLHS
jgi:hypothetical protein